MRDKKVRQFFGGALALILAGLLALWLTPYFSGVYSINPVFIHIGSFTIYWYGLLMAVAVALGVIWLTRELPDKLWENHVISLSAVAIISGIVGARLTFVILKWPEFSGDWISALNISAGGLSIHGALILGALSLWLYCRAYQLPAIRLLATMAPAVMAGQIIGRFGNFFNSEAFGPPTDLPWKMFVAPEFRPVGLVEANYFHPTFLYSAIGLLAILVIIYGIYRRSYRPSAILLAYAGLYSLLRFGIEFLRVDSDYVGQLSIAQWASLGIIITVVVISLILRYKVSSKS